MCDCGWVYDKPYTFFKGFILHRRPQNGFIHGLKLFHNIMHVHAFVPVCKHRGAKQGAVLLQHGIICGIRHDEMIPRQHEHAVKHGHGAPHVGVKAVHIVKIFMEHEFAGGGMGEMIQNAGIVPLQHGLQHKRGHFSV